MCTIGSIGGLFHGQTCLTRELTIFQLGSGFGEFSLAAGTLEAGRVNFLTDGQNDIAVNGLIANAASESFTVKLGMVGATKMTLYANVLGQLLGAYRTL